MNYYLEEAEYDCPWCDYLPSKASDCCCDSPCGDDCRKVDVWVWI